MTNELSDLVIAHDRASLARAITLVESSKPDHRRQAVGLLDAVMASTGTAVRIGISGPPGVGKSTLIDELGLSLIARGHRPAVLTIDPSSVRSGGSILGDKTRMGRLANRPEAFIRPSPSQGRFGGVAGRTPETLLLCEAAGFDVVIVETVGVGQSETAVADITDVFVLLVAPGSGDDLQGIKRGVMELVDLVIVNKADGANLAAASHTAADYRSAAGLLRPKHDGISTAVLTCSAFDPPSVDAAWTGISDRWFDLRDRGIVEEQRRRQRVSSVHRLIGDLVLERLEPVLSGTDDDEMMTAVADGRRAPLSAATELVAGIDPGQDRVPGWRR